MTDVNVVVKSPNPKASIGVVLNNRANKSLCLLELTADKNTLLFCLQGDKRRDIASVPMWPSWMAPTASAWSSCPARRASSSTAEDR